MGYIIKVDYVKQKNDNSGFWSRFGISDVIFVILLILLVLGATGGQSLQKSLVKVDFNKNEADNMATVEIVSIVSAESVTVSVTDTTDNNVNSYVESGFLIMK